MMMLTTQLTYTPTACAITSNQQPAQTVSSSNAIGIMKAPSISTDVFDEKSTSNVTKPEIRNGMHIGIPLLIATGVVGFLIAQEPVRNFFEDIVRKLTKRKAGGEQDNETKSHRSKTDENEGDEVPDSLPTKYQEKIRQHPSVAKSSSVPFHRKKTSVTAKEPEEAFA